MKRVVSYFIVLLFSGLILSGSGYVMKKAFDSDTNWDYIADMAVKPTPKESARKPQVLAENNTCVAPRNTLVAETNSVVDYFYRQGEDYSFDHRAIVAKDNGIENYVGSKDQNLLLIKKLKEKTIACL